MPSASIPARNHAPLLLDAPPATMDRREALRRTALLLGGAVSAPTLAALLAGCESPRADGATWRPRTLTGDRERQVALIAEHIIPATDTPGAEAAGVHRFIDVMLTEYYAPPARDAFLTGLADLDARATRAKGKAFLALSHGEQRGLLEQLDAEAFHHTAAARGKPASHPQSFMRTMKELTLLGYYTSSIGATQELRYAQVPGRYDGCVPLSSIGRAWST